MPGLDSNSGLDRLLARVPAAERADALEDLANALSTKNDLPVAEWILSASQSREAKSVRGVVFIFLKKLHETEPASIVAFCARSTLISQWVLHTTASDLEKELDRLESAAEAADVDEHVANSSTVSCSLTIAASTVIRLLQLLDVVYESNVQHGSVDLDEQVQAVLFRALSAHSTDVSLTARLTIRKWLEAIVRSRLPIETTASLQQRLWEIITASVQGGPGPHYATGFILWWYSLDLLSTSDVGTSDHFRRVLLASDESWATLQRALIVGDTEVRRNVLRILRKSVNLMDDGDMKVRVPHFNIAAANKVSVQRSMERFCTAFETVVMGRYINQIRELETDLDALANPAGVLSDSWILTLLHPAMSNRMQESIRGFFGGWILKSGLSPSTHMEAMISLLEESLLPWATRGALFTHSIRGVRDSIVSAHGENVSDFVFKLLKSGESASQLSARMAYLQAILGYLMRFKYNTMSYAMAYVLLGLQRALSTWTPQVVDASSIAALSEIAATPSMPEIPRDLIVVLCCEISSTISGPQSKSHDDIKLASVRTSYKKLLDAGAKEQVPAVAPESVGELLEEIQKTRSASLKGQGLVDTCCRLATVLDNQDAEIAASTLALVLDSIWEQVEIQDYPKDALLKVPALFLHPRSVEKADKDADLLGQIAFFLDAYQDLTGGRIYTWTPFMYSLRRAILTVPNSAITDHLPGIIERVARSPPSPKPEFLLDAAAANLLTAFSNETSHLSYEHYFGVNAAVGWAAYFDLLAHLDSNDAASSAQLLDTLLEPWVEQRVPAVIINLWKTTEWLQTMLILMESTRITSDIDSAKLYAQKFMYLLSLEPLPRFRYLLEWLLCRLIQRHRQFIDLAIEVLSSIDHHGNPKYLASVVKIAVGVVCSKSGDEDMAKRIVSRLASLAASSKIIIRHEAQWALPTFWNHAEAQGWTAITEDPVMLALMDYIHSLERTIIPAPERENSRFNLDADHSIATLLCGTYLGLDPTVTPRLEMTDYQRMLDLDKQAGFAARSDLHRCMPVGVQPRARAKAAAFADASTDKKVTASDDLVALQTKGTSYLSGTIEEIKSKRHNSGLLVVGSLVDNPYNVGGLSRVAEIFGAAALYVASTKVLTHRDFESVAVSSHMHFDVKELPRPAMSAFFTQKKVEGYCIVGIEQTDRSKILGRLETVLPEKTVLVLGAEREGMPADVLAVCDLLVEIPQKGSTRSMNVQTAAACVLFDYCRQHA